MRTSPSDPSDDSTFYPPVFSRNDRRAANGWRDPRVSRRRAPEKRARLIDALLERPEYVDFWTLKWSDRTGCNQWFVGPKRAYSCQRWIRDQVAANVPFNQFVCAIVTAKGSNYTGPPACFYRRLRNPEGAVENVDQLFPGVRLWCARCHNHLAERWTRDDYYGMAALFSQVRFKNGPQFYAQYNKEETVFPAPNAQVVQPRNGVTMPPKPLVTAPRRGCPGADRRDNRHTGLQ